MSEVRWNRVTVVGCGLVGASFALALRRAGLCARIAGWDVSAAALDEAVRRGVVDEVDRAFAGAAVSSSDLDYSSSDLVYLAMPVREIIGFLKDGGRQVKPGALVTDAGSTKVEVCRASRRHLPADRQFIGGHPVAGYHLGGLEHARADLFAGASYVLVAGEDGHSSSSLELFAEALGLIGARVCLMTAREHDRAMALLSHAPQLLASALAAVVREQPDADALAGLAGAGYRDMTRLAASPWAMWRDILATNPTEISAALDALARRLSAARDELRDYAARGGGELNVTRGLFGEDRASDVTD